MNFNTKLFCKVSFYRFNRSDDYIRFTPFLQQGGTLFITGHFKQRFNTPEYEFKIVGITSIETIKRNLTKQLCIDVHPKNISEKMISFIEGNVKSHPGRSSLKFNLLEPKNNLKISFITLDTGFEMNDEMVDFLDSNPDMDVQILTV